jgi:pimeloyl-ACP methyl ester carboxylesterase
MDPIRRKLLKTGAAATAMAAAQHVFAQQTGPGGAPMSFYEKGPVRIRYEEAGSGVPLLLSAGGGLNSTIAGLKRGDPFHAIDEFKGEYRCIASDLRNANGGQSSGPLEIDRPWDSYTDDHLGVMDHLGIDKFMVMGFCIGGPFIWNLLERAPDRIVAAVLAQPSGSRPEMRDLFYETNSKGWGPELVKRRPEITMDMVDRFLTRMYRTNPDFVFTVTRDFVRKCQTPVLILPDDIPAHPYAVAMEAAMLAPKAEVSMFPWKEPKERVPLAVRQIRSFLRAHRPVGETGSKPASTARI